MMTGCSRDLCHALREGVYPVDLVVDAELVQRPHLLLLEPEDRREKF